MTLTPYKEKNFSSPHLDILPIISIVIPFYNAEKYIIECLKSIEDQSINSDLIEIIAVDDCSTDRGLAKILDHKIDLNIIIDKLPENSGPGIARNKGISLASGKYILFLDSDDKLYVDSLPTLLEMVTTHDYDLITYNWTYLSDIKENTTPLKRRRDLNDMPTKREQIINHYLGMNMDGSVIYTLIEKALISRYNIRFPKGLHEDMSVIFEMYYSAKKICKLDKVIYVKRNVEGSIVNTLSENHVKGYLGAWSLISKFLDGQGVLFREYETSYLRGMSGHVYTLIIKIIQMYPYELDKRVNFYHLIIKYLGNDDKLKKPYHKFFPKHSKKDIITQSFLSIMLDKKGPALDKIGDLELSI